MVRPVAGAGGSELSDREGGVHRPNPDHLIQSLRGQVAGCATVWGLTDLIYYNNGGR